MENDVLFYEKRRVVLWETTARFVESDGGRMDDAEKWKWKNRNLNCEKICSIPSSRAYAYAHLQEFLLFCCHKCHSIWGKTLFYSALWHFCIEFNNLLIRGSENQWKREGKACFSGLHSWGISFVFSLIYLVFLPQKYSTCDTCDSKKSTSLLEGAHATRTHVREAHAH